ncbi:barstar family protein [Proteus myxofaciens]|uniref:Putative ribonuclease inhibitor n=1 Tax=Proteus myxofaciens ATCC 19692 TaxID=1354337 RepID=A0A198FPL8_9GAMM|nr:barstar family protein [Proteus myxofaciens]OAT26101.1 putative ribonuclease inhibitor [Proteus myxofaciens ATCC 19692]
MKQITFDFKTLTDRDAFYRQFALKFHLFDDFGANLDALWDVLTGEIELPVTIIFKHFPHHSDAFQPLMDIMREAQRQLGDDMLIFYCDHKC